jgi:hypothetical protein
MRKIRNAFIIAILTGVIINFFAETKVINDASSPTFRDGEKLTFDIKYGFVTAGQATLEVEETVFRDNVPVYQITSKARTTSFFDRIFKVRDEIESIMDKETLLSHRFTKRLNEGRYQQYRIHYYYPEQGFTKYLRYSFKDRKFNEEELEILEETQDILSAFYWIRKQDLKPDSSQFVNVTADGRNYTAEVKVHRTETLKTIFGSKECLVLEPILEGDAIFKQTGSILIWVTNDEYKIPVKMTSQVTFGSFTANLTAAKNVPY